MFLVYIWLYTLFLVIVWGFFIVTKIHAYKFKNFSNYMTKVFPLIFIVMLSLSIIWYIIIFISNTWNSTYKIDTKANSFDSIEY